jgi:hypothetical protein
MLLWNGPNYEEETTDGRDLVRNFFEVNHFMDLSMNWRLLWNNAGGAESKAFREHRCYQLIPKTSGYTVAFQKLNVQILHCKMVVVIFLSSMRY